MSNKFKFLYPKLDMSLLSKASNIYIKKMIKKSFEKFGVLLDEGKIKELVENLNNEDGLIISGKRFVDNEYQAITSSDFAPMFMQVINRIERLIIEESDRIEKIEKLVKEKPICVLHKCFMISIETDNQVSIGTKNKVIFKADLYKCPNCNNMTYSRFGEAFPESIHPEYYSEDIKDDCHINY